MPQRDSITSRVTQFEFISSKMVKYYSLDFKRYKLSDIFEWLGDVNKIIMIMVIIWARILKSNLTDIPDIHTWGTKSKLWISPPLCSDECKGSLISENLHQECQHWQNLLTFFANVDHLHTAERNTLKYVQCVLWQITKWHWTQWYYHWPIITLFPQTLSLSDILVPLPTTWLVTW